MTIHEAATLLRTPLIDWTQPQIWCDLGCGEGLFTMALATLLAPGSTIYAVDQSQSALANIPDGHEGVIIRKMHGNLNNNCLQLPRADGILIANALHFIPQQENLLKRLRDVSKRLLIVEYERSQRSRWGPYPVTFRTLRNLCQAIGLGTVTQVGIRKSRFGGMMYSALAEAVTEAKDMR